MLIDYTREQLINISEKSLWLIMDPWKNQESMSKESSVEYLGLSLNQWNGEYMKKIFEYANCMKNKIVVTDDIKNSPDFMQDYLWISHHNQNGRTILENFIKERKLDNIIYCGFHEQRCILHRKNFGHHNMDSKYNCYIEWNLTCPWPGKNWRAEQSYQRALQRYNYIDIVGVNK